MEKEKLFANAACLNWQCSSTMDMQLAELNSEQLPMLMNLHLENSMNQAAEFEPTYSSIVTSPQALGTICTPPLSSPPKLNLATVEQQARGNHPISVKTMMPFPTDPGFAERAAKNSCFGNQSCFGGLELPDISKMENGKLPRVSSSQSLKPHGSLVGGAENNREESSVSEQITNEASGRKRKAAPPKGRVKDDAKASEDDDSDTKRSKSSDTSGAEKPKAEQGGNQKQSKDSSKPPEPPKDYIHVRARRGQATDSHSLAERVRREKISERMKVLQDLVPGCNKVTGKAVMLDEIINYVQSLQRQVEFLSMKLATVNPRLDFDIESLLSKDVHHLRNGLPQNGSSFALDSTTLSAFPFAHHPSAGPPEANCPINPLPAPLRRSLSMQLPTMDGFGDAAAQLAGMWEDDLQTVVQMGYGQNQDLMFPTQNFHGILPTAQMKVEL